MLLFIILFIVINQVNGDMAPVLIQPDNVFDEDNIIITLLWTLSIGSCVGLVCKHKNKIPLEIKEIEPYWEYPCYDEGKKFYEVNMNDNGCLRKLQTSLEEVKGVLNKLEDIKKELAEGRNKSKKIIKQHERIFKLLKPKKGDQSPRQYGY